MRIRMAEDYVYDTLQDCAEQDCESIDWPDEQEIEDEDNQKHEQEDND